MNAWTLISILGSSSRWDVGVQLPDLCLKAIAWPSKRHIYIVHGGHLPTGAFVEMSFEPRRNFRWLFAFRRILIYKLLKEARVKPKWVDPEEIVIINVKFLCVVLRFIFIIDIQPSDYKEFLCSYHCGTKVEETRDISFQLKFNMKLSFILLRWNTKSTPLILGALDILFQYFFPFLELLLLSPIQLKASIALAELKSQSAFIVMLLAEIEETQKAPHKSDITARGSI